MERRNLIILGGAVLFGLLAVVLANSWFSRAAQREPTAASGAQALTRIAVASQDLPFGAPLTGQNVHLVAWPAGSVPQGAVAESDLPRLLSTGKVAIRPIATGEPVLLSRISTRAVLSANIPADMRAVTVPVDAVTGVAGFVAPGDTVDVLLTRQRGSDAGDMMTNVVLENVQVLAMDSRSGADQTQADGKDIKTATLLVDPLGAQKIALSAQIGKLTLALRNVQSPVGAPARTVTPGDLGGGGIAVQRRSSASAPAPVRRVLASAVATTPSRPAGPTMAVVRGTETTVEEVQRHVR